MANVKRNTDETFQDYKSRLKMINDIDKDKSKGTLVWNSSKNGTYVKRIHGSL